MLKNEISNQANSSYNDELTKLINRFSPKDRFAQTEKFKKVTKVKKPSAVSGSPMKSEYVNWKIAKNRQQFDLPSNGRQQSQRTSFKKMTPSPYR